MSKPNGPLGRIRTIQEQRRQLEAELVEVVVEARDQGYSWGQIGGALGMSRHGARNFYQRSVNSR